MRSSSPRRRRRPGVPAGRTRGTGRSRAARPRARRSRLGVPPAESTAANRYPFAARGVAQPGSALRSGRRGPQFESGHPDFRKAGIRESGFPPRESPPAAGHAPEGARCRGRNRCFHGVRSLPGVSSPIRYARSGDVNIAYQVTGDGPFDLVLVKGFFSHLDPRRGSRSSSPGRGPRASPTASSPRSSSRTSSARPSASRTWGTPLDGAATTATTPRVRRAPDHFSGEELDTAGDGFLPSLRRPGPAIRSRSRIRRPPCAALGLDVRAGVHTGEVERRRGRGRAGSRCTSRRAIASLRGRRARCS